MTSKPKCSMRLYKAAGCSALVAALLWPAVYLLQSGLVKKTILLLLEEGRDLPQVFRELFELFNESHTSLVYDMPHLPATVLMVPYLIFFSLCCFLAKDRKGGKRRCCVFAGIGLECYALVSFLANVVVAATLYYSEWSAGVSHRVIMRILFTAFGSGFAELAMISLFAIALIVTGYTCKNRPFAVATGAICIYRLLEDSLWLFAGVFDGTLAAAPTVQIVHGVLFLVAMSLTLGGAVLVAMSSVKEEPEEMEETEGEAGV